MSEPIENRIELSAGTFRTLTWPGDPDIIAIFLHGLTGVADVWHPTITALGPDRPRCIALDQRGHGSSPHTPGSYRAVDHLGDLLDLVDEIGAPVHLVGHSMGARIAILAGARFPDRFRSVAIVDIGPEAWKVNIEATTRLIASRPERFTDRAEARAVAEMIVERLGTGTAESYVTDRMVEEPDGSYRWLSPTSALIETVTAHRSRNHWRDWDRVRPPAIFVRGGDTDEVREPIARKMRQRNPSVDYRELPGVGHNIPLLAPTALAEILESFWRAST